MHKLLLAAGLLSLSTQASADRYGIAESSGGSTPIWALGLLVVGLVVFHLKEVSRLSSDVTSSRFDAERAATEAARLREELARAEADRQAEALRYATLQGLIQDYFDGELTDDEFLSKAEDYVEPYNGFTEDGAEA